MTNTTQAPWEGEATGEVEVSSKPKRTPKAKPAPVTFQPGLEAHAPKVDKKAEKAALKEAVDAAVSAATEKVMARAQSDLEKLVTTHNKAVDKLKSEHEKAFSKGQKDFDKLEEKLGDAGEKIAALTQEAKAHKANLALMAAANKDLQKKFDGIQLALVAQHKASAALTAERNELSNTLVQIRGLLPSEKAKAPRAKKEV